MAESFGKKIALVLIAMVPLCSSEIMVSAVSRIGLSLPAEPNFKDSSAET